MWQAMQYEKISTRPRSPILRAEWWRNGPALLTNAAVSVLGGILLEFTRTGVGEYFHYVHGFSETVLVQIVVYLGAILLLELCPTNHWTLRIILLIALAARLITVIAPPFLSTDIYRYVWDGLVQGAGINPFRFIPADSHLAFLRDANIYPNINRRDYAHTIYPPGSQMIFWAVTRIRPTVTAMKLAMVGFEAATCYALIRCLKLLHMRAERVLLYAWSPVCLWEIGSSGHADAAALTFISFALLARLTNRDKLAGGWLGAATLVKLYPIALLPAFLRDWRSRAPWVMVGVIATGYTFYLRRGVSVFGFLPGFAQEEGMQDGTRYFPLAFLERNLHLAIPTFVYLSICAVFLAALAWWAFRRGAATTTCVGSGLVLATALTLCFSPHYPWYFLWLLPFLTLRPWPPAFFLALAPTYLLTTKLGVPGEPMYRLNCFLYGGFFLLLVNEWLSNYVPKLLMRKLSEILSAVLPIPRHRASGDVTAQEQL
jgi:alpha-1,6-mannosyltransferase